MSEAEIELLLRLDYITGCQQSDLDELGIDASKFDVKEKITNLIKKYKEQEKIIDSMALSISNYDSQLAINTFRDKEEVKTHYEELLKTSIENIISSQIEAKLEELYEELDRLKDCQKKVLGYGGDDLWIRDEIAELEDLIHTYERGD